MLIITLRSVTMESEDIEGSLVKYYDGKAVNAIVGIKSEMDKVDSLSKTLAGNPSIRDVFIVTGDFDIIIKVRFPEFWNLHEFLVDELIKLPGVRETKTMMVLSTLKDSGNSTTMGWKQ
jgi:DNA-binding Lrp family transcriptional regulator